jgi:protein-tyrosine-phosphatase/N-acetylglutamate synthase-like GNAT family acetyltransferase
VPAVLALLQDAGLPTADLKSAQGLQMWVLEAKDSVLGVIALERFGSEALLRSLAVAPECRKRGFGHELVARLEQDAQADGVEQLVLLTETAEPFFRTLGYDVIDRRNLSEEVKQSAEFRSLCPASAVCMRKAIHSRESKIRMAERIYNILFLCTGNSARSILAESIINNVGKGRFRGFSAGSHPKGQVHPIALDLLRHLGLPTEGLRSKSWDEFAASNGPHLDFVFTVCDNAAGEMCPHWPGQPMTAHWGIPDPAAVEGTDIEKSLAFGEAFRAMETRIKLFLSLPLATIDRMRLKERLDSIGQTPTPADDAH